MDRKNISSAFQWVVGFIITSSDRTHGMPCSDAAWNMHCVVVWLEQ